jgi:hypothetical protein
MYDEVIVTGRIASAGRPHWRPLEAFLPLELCGPFMWMHAVELEDGRVIQAYKHSMTRRYLQLDADGDSYENLDHGRFRRMRHSDAIEQAFSVHWLLNHASEEEKDSVRQALAAAWDRGNGDVAAGAHILPSSPACGFRRLP